MDEKVVLFASQRTYTRAENIKSVYDAYDGEKDFICLEGKRNHPLIKSGRYSLMVIDEFPVSSPGKVLMIWHAIDGGKKIGFDQPNAYLNKRDSKLITRIVTSGTGTVKMQSEYSGVPIENVMALGMPRTDAYVGKKKGDGNTILAGKRSYLYAPTFRNKDETPLPLIDWDLLDDLLCDNEVIAVKPHMNSGRVLQKEYKHIIEISPSKPSAEYLYDCNVLITDYSTIMFDAYLLEKPVVLFEKRTGYVQSRGMYFMYPAGYSSRYCNEERRLIHELRNANDLTDTERWIIQVVADKCDGHATERVCGLIHRMLEE